MGRRGPKAPGSPYDPTSKAGKERRSARSIRREEERDRVVPWIIGRYPDYSAPYFAIDIEATSIDESYVIKSLVDKYTVTATVHDSDVVREEVEVPDYGKLTIRGCGDPMCEGCNAHLRDIPIEVRSTIPRVPPETEYGSGGGGIDRSGNDYAAVFDSGGYERMRRAAMGAGFQAMPIKKAGPPKSYTDARELVERYILKDKHTTGWDDVVGNDDAKQALLEAIEEPTRAPELYAHYGMTPPKGIVLYGPPGCGKTMFAKASAAAMSRIHGKEVDVLVVQGAELQSPFIGITEMIIKNIFTYAREYKAYNKHPMVLFIDEAEVFLPDRTGRARIASSWEQSQVAQFLAEMDGMKELGAFIILATNRPEMIDEALMRDGRCDRKIKVRRPDQVATEVILRKTLAGLPLAEGVTLDEIVMVAAESFFNPHYILTSGNIVHGFLSEKGEPQVENIHALNFCLEHIVNGAMVTGVGNRIRSRAFRRDRDAGTVTGARPEDVVGAIKEIYEENKKLEHAYAMQEFTEAIPLKEIVEAHIAKQQSPKGKSGLN